MSSASFTCDGPFGKITTESDTEYHAKRAISKSKLSDFMDSPAYFEQKYLLGKIPDNNTPAKRFGRAFHHLMRVGPVQFALDYPCEPEFGDCRKKENKAVRDEWRAEHPLWETNSITANDKVTLDAMLASIMSHPDACQLVVADGGECEVSFRAKSENLPLAVQCRADLINMRGCALSQRRPFIVDYKSIDNLTVGVDPRYQWEKTVVDRRYYLQDPFYLAVIDMAGVSVEDMEFYYIVTEKNPPCATMVFKPDEIAQGTGRRVIRDQMNTLAECLETGNWPAAPVGVQTHTVPEYLLNRAFRKATSRT